MVTHSYLLQFNALNIAQVKPISGIAPTHGVDIEYLKAGIRNGSVPDSIKNVSRNRSCDVCRFFIHPSLQTMAQFLVKLRYLGRVDGLGFDYAQG